MATILAYAYDIFCHVAASLTWLSHASTSSIMAAPNDATHRKQQPYPWNLQKMSSLILSLLTFALIATASPGGATTLATASGAQFGFARSMPLIAGIALGLASLVSIVGGVLGAVILSWPQFQFLLRVVGSAYLLWLAWTISRLGAPNAPSSVPATPKRFITGVLLLWLNPKAWTMAVTVATAYTGLADHPVRFAVLTGSVFALAATLSLTLWCMGGLWLATVLKTEQQWRAVNVVLAVLLASSVIPMWR